MKFLHTADLRLGKSLLDLSIFSDQDFVLGQLISVAIKEEPGRS